MKTGRRAFSRGYKSRQVRNQPEFLKKSGLTKTANAPYDNKSKNEALVEWV